MQLGAAPLPVGVAAHSSVVVDYRNLMINISGRARSSLHLREPAQRPPLRTFPRAMIVHVKAWLRAVTTGTKRGSQEVGR